MRYAPNFSNKSSSWGLLVINSNCLIVAVLLI